MKLKKPTSTKHANDLQDYVSNLLMDEIKEVNKKDANKKEVSKIDGSNVTPLGRRTVITPKSIPDKPARDKLTHDEPTLPYVNESDPRLKKVEQLLSKISLTRLHEIKTEIKAEVVTDSQSPVEFENTQQVNQKLESAETAMAKSSFAAREEYPLKKIVGDVFQTLVFEVNRLTMAVPLLKLGGIIDISEQDITPLVGTPDWFMGLVPNERGNLMVVDTQQFLMPEKTIVKEKKYNYLIILDDSQWALACHSVGEAKNLTPDDIRWSARSSSRPWFAGMVVEHLSALLEVDELINLLAKNIVEK